MFLALLILAAVYLVVLGITVHGLVTAPDGYQDENGFHRIWCNNTPEARDVACIWDAAPAL